MRISTNVFGTLMMGLLFIAGDPGEVGAQLCGDPNADGRVTVSDGVDILRASAGLSTGCITSICDVDGSGTVSVTDGVLVLRAAADLPSQLVCDIEARQACLLAVRTGNLEASADVCATAAAADANDLEVKALAEGSSAVVASLTAPELTAMLDALGFERAGSGANICDVVVRRRGDLPEGAPRTGAVATTLRGRGLELIDRLLASAAEAPTSASFEFSCPGFAEQGLAVEIDFGDLLVARYELHFYAALIHVAAAYDLDLDLVGPLNGGASFRDVFFGNPSLFALRGGSGVAELGLARNRLDMALASFIAAVNFIGAESDDQSNDFFVISLGDVATLQREREGAQGLRAALTGSARFDAATFDLPSDQRLSLDDFFDGAMPNLRSLVPGFQVDGDVDQCQVDDSTFGGILPDLEVNAATGCLDPKNVDFVGGRFGPFLPIMK